LPGSCAHLDNAGYHAPSPHEPSCGGAERNHIHRAQPYADHNAVEEVDLPQAVNSGHEEQPHAEENRGDREQHPRTEPVVELAHKNAEEAHEPEGQGMSAGQGGPGPIEIGQERFEKNTESHMGADPCRLDGKAGGCSHIAVE